MAVTGDSWNAATTPEPTHDARGQTHGEVTGEAIVRALQDQFGDEYQESYEEGKRQFRDALVRTFDMDRDDAANVVDELEESRTIRFHRQGVDGGVEVPRVGLFDVPETATPNRTDREYAGRYWVIGRTDFLPDAASAT